MNNGYFKHQCRRIATEEYETKDVIRRNFELYKANT